MATTRDSAAIRDVWRRYYARAFRDLTAHDFPGLAERSFTEAEAMQRLLGDYRTSPIRSVDEMRERLDAWWHEVMDARLYWFPWSLDW